MLPPDGTCLISKPVAGPRATCAEIDWRLTFSRWRSVKTMAPIIAVSRIMPAPWKK